MLGGGGVSKALRVVTAISATFFGGTFAIYAVASSVSQRRLSDKKKKYGKPCQPCKGVGYYTCKVCKGNATIMWSPLYDPVVVNPCVCPTCDGFKVQRCLNCLGCGSVL